MTAAAEPLLEPSASTSLDREIAELVAVVREEPYIELDIDESDPLLAAHVRFLALSPEQRAHELNRCEALHETGFYWRVDGGEPVREVEPFFRREYDRRRVWRRALAARRGRLARIVRPLVRVRDRGRARGGGTLRRSRARSPGRRPDDPEPLAALEAAA